MNFNLTNIKTAPSRNGLSMTADFWINGVHVADFEDSGNGSQPTLSMHCNETAMKLFAAFDAGIEMLPELLLPGFDVPVKVDQGLFIDLLHSAIVSKQEFKMLAA